jgi:hypothetical protein
MNNKLVEAAVLRRQSHPIITNQFTQHRIVGGTLWTLWRRQTSCPAGNWTSIVRHVAYAIYWQLSRLWDVLEPKHLSQVVTTLNSGQYQEHLAIMHWLIIKRFNFSYYLQSVWTLLYSTLLNPLTDKVLNTVIITHVFITSIDYLGAS